MASNALAELYDLLPYPSQAYAASHPARLAAIAQVHGLTPPAPAAARVLELGCASGGNLIPMAVEAPSAAFVGLDLSERQIGDARAMASALGADNVRFEAVDFTEWGADEPFDYIIAHGLFSWVSPEVRAAFWRFCADNLRADGLVYVSYNALPGWHSRGALREMMLYHTASVSDPVEKVQQARALLGFLARNTKGDDNPYAMWLRNEDAVLRDKNDAFIFHDLLSPDNHAFTLTEVIDEGATAGLGYVGEADGSHWLDQVLNPDIVRALKPISQDRPGLLRAIDLFKEQTFHCSIFRVGSAATEPTNGPWPGLMAMVSPRGRRRDYVDEGLRQNHQALLTAGPLGVDADALPGGSGKTLGLCADRAAVLRVVEQPRAPGQALAVTPLVRWQVEQGWRVVTNRDHEQVELDRFDALLISMLAEPTHIEALVAGVVDAQRAGTFSVQVDDTAISTEQLVEAIDEAVRGKVRDFEERRLLR